MAEIAHNWWLKISHYDKKKGTSLRRCKTLEELAINQQAISLAENLAGAGFNVDYAGVFLAAGVLACVTSDVPKDTTRYVPVWLATGGKEGRTIISPDRFERICRMEEVDDGLLTALRRAVSLASGQMPVRDLFSSLTNWTASTRERWMYEFFSKTEKED